jgi:pimeloyl-ACP methyl ester carboxylesterase
MQQQLGPARRAVLITLLSALLAACGGGGGSAPGPVAPAPPPVVVVTPPVASEALIQAPVGRGELKSATALATVAVGQIVAAIAAPGVKISGVAPRYSVLNYRLTYNTVDGNGQPVVASGLVSVPDKPAGAPNTLVESPVISYQHGTIFKDAEAPSNNLAPVEPTLVMASLGYIVVAADYVGYGASKGVQHPYLLSAPTAAAVNDLLTAARLWRQQSGKLGNGQLFLVGYSEGAYATMAAHRELVASKSLHLANVVASVGGGGPYDVGTTLDRLLARVKDESVVLGALINPGFLSRLGSTVRNEVRRQIMKQVLPDDADVSFQSTFLDNFLADDVAAIDRMSNVIDWKPNVPFRMFHGKDDQTVPYKSSTVALEYMLKAGAAPGNVSLTDCSVKPADHLPCVPPFFTAMMNYLGLFARGL